MDTDLERSRLALHGIAELVLAGPQYDESHTIRLRVTPGGFGTVAVPDLRVDGTDLVARSGRFPLEGTFGGLARSAGVSARSLEDVYAGGPGIRPDDPVDLDPASVAVVLNAFAAGDRALRAFAPEVERVLWPEHFDLGITRDEVNYGVSPGDEHVPGPYAYVGPWTAREGSFWNTPFGAARPLVDLPTTADLVAFFEEGAGRALTDPAR
jgi:hypothetical protein